MAEYIATEDSTFSFDVSTAGSVSIVPATSVAAKFQVKTLGTYTSMGIVVSGATNGTVTGASGVAVITGGAAKVSSGGLYVVLEGDCVPITLLGMVGTTPTSYPDTVTIATAGQTVTKAT